MVQWKRRENVDFNQKLYLNKKEEKEKMIPNILFKLQPCTYLDSQATHTHNCFPG